MVTSEPITKMFITRTEEHSVQQELRIPQELINHPRLKEILEHTEEESKQQLEVLNMIPESTLLVASKLLEESKQMLQPVVSTEEPSKLKQMLHESEIVIQPSEKVGERTSKVLQVEGARHLVVCKSALLNQAHVTAHHMYSKEKEVSIRFARNDLSKQKVTYNLSQAPDLVLEVQTELLNPDVLRKNKRAIMLKLVSEGWNVLGLLPKD